MDGKDAQSRDGDLIFARGWPKPVFPFLVVVGDILEPPGILVLPVGHAVPGATAVRADVPTEAEPMGGHTGLPNAIFLRRNEDGRHGRLAAKCKIDVMIRAIC